jgi:hypothetical protein
MTDGRRDNGQFAPGCPPGPGRPPLATEFQFLRAMRAAVSPDDFTAVVRKALEQAKAGDARARDWVARYVLPQDTSDKADFHANWAAALKTVDLDSPADADAESCVEPLSPLA